jgi:hypothetical protein
LPTAFGTVYSMLRLTLAVKLDRRGVRQFSIDLTSGMNQSQ